MFQLIERSQQLENQSCTRSIMQAVDQRIYKMLVDQDQSSNQSAPTQYGSGFIVHLVFKIIPIALMWLRGFLSPLISSTVMIQLILLFVVIDFWLTKNITGKRMIGMKWGFDQNQYGDEKFTYEGRVNQQLVNALSSKLFWIIQFIYMVIPIVFIVFGILNFASAYSTWSLQLNDILLYVAILLGGGVNFFFFMKARQGVKGRRMEMTSKLGNQFMSQMGNATIVSYL